jgi:catechol 2,3-dioxygenase-like lactoylglutathione lyase family enzyme
MISIDRIDHVVLTCRDVAATTEFYARVLGMREVTFGAGRKALAFGRQKLNLQPATPDHTEQDIAARAALPTPGAVDLCLVVAQPIEEVQRHLAQVGVPLVQGPVQRTGALGELLSVYIRDPDGNLIELSNYR